jgi:hypothetical protein
MIICGKNLVFCAVFPSRTSEIRGLKSQIFITAGERSVTCGAAPSSVGLGLSSPVVLFAIQNLIST